MICLHFQFHILLPICLDPFVIIVLFVCMLYLCYLLFCSFNVSTLNLYKIYYLYIVLDSSLQLVMNERNIYIYQNNKLNNKYLNLYILCICLSVGDQSLQTYVWTILLCILFCIFYLMKTYSITKGQRSIITQY